MSWIPLEDPPVRPPQTNFVFLSRPWWPRLDRPPAGARTAHLLE